MNDRPAGPHPMMTKVALLLGAASAVVACAGCAAQVLPAAPQPTQYVPEFAGPIPIALEPDRASRVVLDVRAPGAGPGARQKFWVYKYAYGTKELLCQQVPCIIDMPLQQSQQLTIANFDQDVPGGSPTGYYGLGDDRNLYSKVTVTPNAALVIVLVNMGRDNLAGPSESFQAPGVLEFVPPADVQSRFLPRAAH